jgi:hydrogenase nickel incorporation protein HypA/HybF
MHEYSVTKALVDVCNSEAERNDIKSIARVRVTIGKFTGFAPDAVRFYFEYLSPGTRCAQAELLFREIPIRITCKECTKTSMIDDPVMVCPVCGSTEIEITSGRELYVESIEGE